MFSLVKTFILLSVIALSEVKCDSSVTEAQMKQLFEPIKLVCVPRSKISPELFDSLKNGNFPEKKELKCFLGCVLEMANMMKKGKLLYDAVIKSIDTMMPDSMKDVTRNAIESCKGVVVGFKDSCEAGYALLKCFHPLNPKFIQLLD